MATQQNPLSHSRFEPGRGYMRANVLKRKMRRMDLPALAPSKPERDTASLAVSEEWSLIQQAIGGDLRAQKHIFSCYTTKLYGTAFAILRNKEDAEDAVQEGLCKAYRKLRSFQGRSSFSTWLTRIVINSALKTRRKKSSHPEASLDEILIGQPERLRYRTVDKKPNPEEICLSAEIRGLVEKQLRQLSPGLRASIQLRDLDGLSPADSIQALGIHESAFRSRISRARQKLADGLRQSLQPRNGILRFRRFGRCTTKPLPGLKSDALPLTMSIRSAVPVPE
jgi:RNA polymerase sigma factor (sigma-70 family)